MNVRMTIRFAHTLTMGLILVASIAMAASGPDVSDELPPVAPTEDEMARLKQGDLLIETVQSDSGQGAARLRALMHSPASTVWDVIRSCELAAVYVDGLEYCEVLEGRPDYSKTHQIVDKGWSSPRVDYIFEATLEPHRSMVFKLVEGNLKKMQGYWYLEETPDGLLVTHQLSVRPQFPAPRWLVKRFLTRGTADLLACIRRLAEGSISPALKRADIKRCPGDPARAESG